MMSSQLKRHWSFIHLLITAHLPQRLAILRTISNDQLGVVCEVILNTLHGHLYVPPATVKSLERHKTLLRELASHNLSRIKKKGVILKNHQLITTLLVTVQPLLETYMQP